MLAEFLADPSLGREERLALLVAAAQRDSVVATTLLVKEIGTVPVEELPKALAAVQAHGATAAVKDFVKKLMEDGAQPRGIRLHAAELLAATDRGPVMSQLYAQLEEPR